MTVEDSVSINFYKNNVFQLSYGTKTFIKASCNHNMLGKRAVKILIVFSPIFVADTKIICGYNFVAPLN